MFESNHTHQDRIDEIVSLLEEAKELSEQLDGLVSALPNSVELVWKGHEDLINVPSLDSAKIVIDLDI